MTKWMVFALLGIAVAGIAAADLLNPRYSPVSEPISRYVNGTAGWLITVAILSIGLASALVVRAVGGRVDGRAGTRGRWVLAVWAGGVLIAGLVPADPPGRWDRPSVADMVHGTAALTALAAFPIAALLLARAVQHGRVAAAVSAVLTVVFAVFMADVMDGPSLGAGGSPTLVGLVERLVIAANLLWLGLAATTPRGYLLKPAVRPLSSWRRPTA